MPATPTLPAWLYHPATAASPHPGVSVGAVVLVVLTLDLLALCLAHSGHGMLVGGVVLLVCLPIALALAGGAVGGMLGRALTAHISAATAQLGGAG